MESNSSTKDLIAKAACLKIGNQISSNDGKFNGFQPLSKSNRLQFFSTQIN